MLFDAIVTYGFGAFWFFLLILVMSLDDEEVSEKERWLTSLFTGAIWPVTYILLIVWDKRERK